MPFPYFFRKRRGERERGRGVGSSISSTPISGVNSYVFPYPGAILDLDFTTQTYWWNGSYRTTAAFTTFTLNGSTFGGMGLTPSTTVDITVALSGVGTVVPGTLLIVGSHSTSATTGNNTFAQIDDGTANERVAIRQRSPADITSVVVDGGVTVANQIPVGGATSATVNVNHVAGVSYDTNLVMNVENGADAVDDTAATMPTVTTLRVGKDTAASTQAEGAVARVILWTSALSKSALTSVVGDLVKKYRLDG